MTIHEIQAKSILRRFKKIDSWFIAKAGLNLYRGCAHDCEYCDGRAEKYQVHGEFGREVAVKSNAVEILRRELQRELQPKSNQQLDLWPREGTPDPLGIRADLASGFVMLGGGVGDSYQPAEAETLAARGVLELFEELCVPVHILTKSALVLRDADLLERISQRAGALVSFSIGSSDDSIGRELEPGASRPTERLSALSELRRRGIPGGVFLLPVIPFVSDSPEMIDQSVAEAVRAGAQYIVFGGMTLKPGRQREHFLNVMGRNRPLLAERIAALYPTNGRQAQWGQATQGYDERITRIFNESARRYSVPPRIPRGLFNATVKGRDLVVVLLEQIHVILEMQSRPSFYGREAWRIAKLPGACGPEMFEGPAGPQAREILATGSCDVYEGLMASFSPRR
ncbi:MAG TPA: radical SAM protein [Spirochaetia bacterium]|nr:radical SAM protein [Spirochaetia bacterium]